MTDQERAEAFAADMAANDFWNETEDGSNIPTETAKEWHRTMFTQAFADVRRDALVEAAEIVDECAQHERRMWGRKTADFSRNHHRARELCFEEQARKLRALAAKEQA